MQLTFRSRIRRITALVVGVVSASTAMVLGSATTAQAASMTLTSPSCGVVRLTAYGAYSIATDGLGNWVSSGKGATKTFSSVPAGTYHYIVTNTARTSIATSGAVKVASCSSSSARRPVRNDLNGDGRGDIVAVTSNGLMFRYLMSSKLALGGGLQIGAGWASYKWSGQVNEATGPGPNSTYMVAVKNDGTIWSYKMTGTRFARPVRIGAGFGSYTSFAVLPVTNAILPGQAIFLAGNASGVKGWALSGTRLGSRFSLFTTGGVAPAKLLTLPDFNGDGWADVAIGWPDGVISIELITAKTYVSSSGIVDRQLSGFGTVRLLQASDENLDGLTDLIGLDKFNRLMWWPNTHNSLGASRVLKPVWRGLLRFS